MKRYEDEISITDDMTFGETLRAIRKSMKCSQVEFAGYLGVSQKSISAWELGTFSPPIETARYIYKRFGYELIARKVNQKDEGCRRFHNQV